MHEFDGRVPWYSPQHGRASVDGEHLRRAALREFPRDDTRTATRIHYYGAAKAIAKEREDVFVQLVRKRAVGLFIEEGRDVPPPILLAHGELAPVGWSSL